MMLLLKHRISGIIDQWLRSLVMCYHSGTTELQHPEGMNSYRYLYFVLFCFQFCFKLHSCYMFFMTLSSFSFTCPDQVSAKDEQESLMNISGPNLGVAYYFPLISSAKCSCFCKMNSNL